MLKATQHAKTQKGEKDLSLTQPMPILLHDYSTRGTAFSIIPYKALPLPLFEDIRLQELKLAVEGAPWAVAPTWPCPPKVSSRAPKKLDPAAEGGWARALQAPPTPHRSSGAGLSHRPTGAWGDLWGPGAGPL